METNKKLTQEEVNEFEREHENFIHNMSYEDCEALERDLEVARSKSEGLNKRFNAELTKCVLTVLVSAVVLSFGLLLSGIAAFGSAIYFGYVAYQRRLDIRDNTILINLLEEDIMEYRSL